ncbi:MAG: hypothetical protein Q9N26_01885 [Aquificota bacterium]|nr:hypothetical protein [Aquificota bacterium]MDQ7083214.1 hypothetical protein [Aquificota bacterium]
MVYLTLFLLVFSLSFYFFVMNSSPLVQIRLFGEVSTPGIPVGLAVLIAFYLGFIAGFLFYPLTYVIKRLS